MDQFVKENYHELLSMGIPIFVMEKCWAFFLQEGWCSDDNGNYWAYSRDIKDLFRLYRFFESAGEGALFLGHVPIGLDLYECSRFNIKKVCNHAEGSSKTALAENYYFDFFIDGEPLSQKLNINRFDKEYCDFDLDIQTDKNAEVEKRKKQIIDKTIPMFLGKIKARNQFNEERLVLYRDSSGSDYFGVISFRMSVLEKQIIWEDIRFESDYEEEVESLKRGINNIEKLTFSKLEYEIEFEEFIEKYCA